MKILSIIALVLSGCTTMPDYDWTRSDRHPLPHRVEVVDQKVVDRFCPRSLGPFQHVMACAVYYPRECVIYTKYDPMPHALYEHEKKHCDGYDHQIIGKKNDIHTT